MNKGILFSAIFYASGLAIAGLSYLALGHEYVHGPGLHHFIVLGTFALGLLLLVGAVVQYFTGQRTKTLNGLIFSNLVLTFCFIFFLIYIFNNERSDNTLDTKESEIRLAESGDTVTMSRDGSIIYIRVKDSVLINFIDSTKINRNEAESIKK